MLGCPLPNIGDVVHALVSKPSYLAGVRPVLVEAVLPPLDGEDWATLLVSVEYGRTMAIQTCVSAGMIVTFLT